MFLARLLFLSCLLSCALSASLFAQCASLTVSEPSVTNISCAGNDGAINLSVQAGAAACSSTQVRLNEIMYSPNVADGRGPTTGEYIELIAPAGTDLSCYSITDGDWVITFPSGSIVGADGLFTIGFDVNYGAGTFDLNLQGCNCYQMRGSLAADELLILTNSGEFVALYNNSGVFIDGLIYGNPSNTTSAQNTPVAGRTYNLKSGLGCGYTSITTPALSQFATITTTTGEGNSYVRLPDGSGAWGIQTFGSLNECNQAGTATYTVLWSNGATTENISGLTAGTYTVTITDNTGCSVTKSATLAPNGPATITEIITDASCGVNNGSIDITVTNGNAPYTYAWSTGATTEDVSGLAAGNYLVTVTTATNCTTVKTITVNAGGSIIANATATNVSCNGLVDGRISIDVTSGDITGATYLWSNGATTLNLVDLEADTYTLTITSANGCETIIVSTITEPTPLSVTPIYTTLALDCDLSPIGDVSFDVTGGTPAYTATWTNRTGNALGYNDLAAGEYTVTIADANGCLVVENFTITAPSLPTVTVNFQDNSQRFETKVDSTIGILAGITNNSYTYNWSIVSNNAANIVIADANASETTVKAAQAGEYLIQLTTTNAEGCTFTDTLVLVVADDFLGFPTAFTPNGDGENDLFRPIQLNPAYIKEFIVYNRWGQVVYDDNNLTNGGWDGTIDGKDQPKDVYIYVITYEIPTMGEKQERGSVMLMR